MHALALHKQPFLTHLLEIRERLVYVSLTLIAGTILGYLTHQKVIAVLTAPLNQTLYYSSPAGGFDFTLKISLFVGLLLCIPVLIYHTVAFLSPLLPAHTLKYTFGLLVSSCLLLVCGALFAYFVSLPAALHFLSQFGSDGVSALISTTEYFSFVTRYVLGFGILFQLPLFLLVANSVKRLEVKTLLTQQRWVILISFILAAILTPTPDIFNQTLMAAPILVLYQLSVLLVWITNKKHGTQERKRKNAT